jgi:hypothetical protein
LRRCPLRRPDSGARLRRSLQKIPKKMDPAPQIPRGTHSIYAAAAVTEHESVELDSLKARLQTCETEYARLREEHEALLKSYGILSSTFNALKERVDLFQGHLLPEPGPPKQPAPPPASRPRPGLSPARSQSRFPSLEPAGASLRTTHDSLAWDADEKERKRSATAAESGSDAEGRTNGPRKKRTPKPVTYQDWKGAVSKIRREGPDGGGNWERLCADFCDWLIFREGAPRFGYDCRKLDHGLQEAIHICYPKLWEDFVDWTSTADRGCPKYKGTETTAKGRFCNFMVAELNSPRWNWFFSRAEHTEYGVTCNAGHYKNRTSGDRTTAKCLAVWFATHNQCPPRMPSPEPGSEVYEEQRGSVEGTGGIPAGGAGGSGAVGTGDLGEGSADVRRNEEGTNGESSAI